MRTSGVVLLMLMVVSAMGCGVQPAALEVADLSGALAVGVDGNVNTDLNVNVDATVQGDVNCTIVCDLNTGDCETICELDEGLPPTPEELGAAIYLANCAACHGDPPGSGFAPDLTGKTAQEILDMFNNPNHPGGSFPNLTLEDIDNLAAWLGSI